MRYEQCGSVKHVRIHDVDGDAQLIPVYCCVCGLVLFLVRSPSQTGKVLNALALIVSNAPKTAVPFVADQLLGALQGWSKPTLKALLLRVLVSNAVTDAAHLLVLLDAYTKVKK